VVSFPLFPFSLSKEALNRQYSLADSDKSGNISVEEYNQYARNSTLITREGQSGIPIEEYAESRSFLIGLRNIIVANVNAGKTFQSPEEVLPLWSLENMTTIANLVNPDEGVFNNEDIEAYYGTLVPPPPPPTSESKL
jgi:hypothetical protein